MDQIRLDCTLDAGIDFRSLGCQEDHQEPYYQPSPGWILGGQVVPDELSGGRLFPGGAMFEISGL